MTTITEVKFVGDGIVSAKFDGKEFSFNNVLSNDHYAAIVEEGITPSAYNSAETMDSIREKRNQLLRDTDWQGMSDVTMSDAQTAYRKKLRDLPATNADPTKIVFPDAP
jgi:hypothetical protein